MGEHRSGLKSPAGRWIHMTNYRGVQGSPLFISVEQKEHTEQLKPKIRVKLSLISQGGRKITNTLPSSLPWVPLSCFCSLFE